MAENEYEVWLGPDSFQITATDMSEAVEKAREEHQNADFPAVWPPSGEVPDVAGVYVLDGPEDDYVQHDDPERFE